MPMPSADASHHPDTDQPVKQRAADPRPARTRAAIFHAAYELGKDGGDLTVNSIVREAGVSRASFYAHFGSLEDVASAMVAHELEKLRDHALAKAAEGMDVQARVRLATHAATAFLAENRAFLRGILDWRISHRAYESLVDLFAGYWDLCLERLGEQVPTDLPRTTLCRFLVGGLLELYIAWLLDDSIEEKGLDAEAEAKALAERCISVLPHWAVVSPVES